MSKPCCKQQDSQEPEPKKKETWLQESAKPHLGQLLFITLASLVILAIRLLWTG